MLHTRLTRSRPHRLVVSFHGFLTDIPPLSVPAGRGEHARTAMADRIRRHLRPYLGVRPGEVRVEASPDVPTGHVLVPTSGTEDGIAGYLHLEAETEDNRPEHQAGIPAWLIAAAILFLALMLLG